MAMHEPRDYRHRDSLGGPTAADGRYDDTPMKSPARPGGATKRNREDLALVVSPAIADLRANGRDVETPSRDPDGILDDYSAYSEEDTEEDRRREKERAKREKEKEKEKEKARKRKEKEKEKDKDRLEKKERKKLKNKLKKLQKSNPEPPVFDKANVCPRYYADVNEGCPPSKFDVENYKLHWGSFKDYEIHFNKKLGEGTYGSVYLATHMPTGNTVVAKTIKAPKKEDKKKKGRESQMTKIQREVKILRSLAGSRDIVKFIDQIKSSKDHLKALIFEYVENPNYKEVFRAMSARAACKYLYHLIRALDYCHSKGIIHRDIKGANVLYDPVSEKLRLIDWGFGTWYRRGVPFDGWPGTRYYKSPDLFLHYRFYDYSVDLWAYGCVMASIIFQREPMFKCKSDDNFAQMYEIAQYLGTNDYKRYLRKYELPLAKEFPASELKGPKLRRNRVDWTIMIRKRNERFCSPEALDLIDRLLVWDHEKRLSSREVLAHSYFDPVREEPAPDLTQERSIIHPLDFGGELDRDHDSREFDVRERETPLLSSPVRGTAVLDDLGSPR